MRRVAVEELAAAQHAREQVLRVRPLDRGERLRPEVAVEFDACRGLRACET